MSDIDPATLQDHRSYLVRYAMLQLRDPNLAEDVVQETLVAAIENKSRFAAQSSPRTWLVGIKYVGGKPYLFALIQFFWEP